METTSLTIPKSSIGPTLKAAGLGSLACIGHSEGMITALMEGTDSSTGSNVAWLESVLPGVSPQQSGDPYLLGIQRIRNLSSAVEEAATMRSDRDTLLYVKDQFSLTGQQLASAMGVSRGGLYKWLDEKATMRDRSRERLAKLKRLADEWSAKVGVPVSRNPWISGENRARLTKLLEQPEEEGVEGAQSLIDELASLKPSAKPTHRSILDIAEEKNWKKLPAHIREAERSSRVPSARTTTD